VKLVEKTYGLQTGGVRVARTKPFNHDDVAIGIKVEVGMVDSECMCFTTIFVKLNIVLLFIFYTPPACCENSPRHISQVLMPGISALSSFNVLCYTKLCREAPKAEAAASHVW
jgi:hypothetical protein